MSTFLASDWANIGRHERGGPIFSDMIDAKHATAAEDSIELVVQVNGKVRSRIMVASDIPEEAAVVAALADPVVARFVNGVPKKIIFVPGRLLNIVA